MSTTYPREQAEHDHAIEQYGVEMCKNTLADIDRHKPFDRKNPEHRWLMSRRAAILRKLVKLNAL
jgi:hypothetical protein